MLKRKAEIPDADLYALKFSTAWKYFKTESFAFWMICAYLFFEYVRPQSIFPIIDFLPWTQLIVIGAFLGIFFDRTIKWNKSFISVLLIFYFILVLLSSFNAYFPEASFDNLDKYYLWVIIYFLIINIVNTRKRFFIFISIFLMASFKLSLSLSLTWAQRGFAFTDWGLMGPRGFFQNSGELAIQMLVYWPIAWAFIHVVKPYIGKAWYYFLMLMPITAMMVILGASSRGAQLALIVQLAVMNYRQLLKPKVAISVCLSVFLIWTLIPDEQKARFETMGEDGTSMQRILYWENGIEMIKENPVLGVGYFNFAPYFAKYYPEDIILGRAELPHNIFIQVGTDTGLSGVFLFALMIIFSFRYASKLRLQHGEIEIDDFGKCLNISLIGFLVAGQFVTVMYYPFFWIHIAFVVALRRIGGGKPLPKLATDARPYI